MSWAEKMAVWKRHRRYNLILSGLFMVSFMGTLLWYTRKRLSQIATDRDLAIAVGAILVMGLCLYLAQNLID
ncbi:MAG TPA: hypothetical protein GXX30_05140 [Firmicutes bacterium]|nr:hypothetical protein [Candidatus Fermentithermobacillaceae bacterium]